MPTAIRAAVHIALFAALTAALGLIRPVFVFEVPITAQSMGPLLAGAIIGARAGFLSQAVFLALVAAGLPLLAGGRGGLAPFVGPGAGYLFAWPIAAALVGVLTTAMWSRFAVWKQALIHFGVSLSIIHVLGIGVWAAFLMKAGDISAGTALLTAMARDAVFLPGDIVKCVLAAVVAGLVRRGFPVPVPGRQ